MSSRTGSRSSPDQLPPASSKVQNVKLVLLGDQGVGKSSIALRYVRGEFTENSEATIGAAFLTQTTSVSNQTIKFDIWDTAGQERYHSLAPMYYRGAQAAVIVYDITSKRSFNKAVEWVKELKQQANAQIVMVLAGNKADMASEKRAVSREDASAFAEEQNLVFTESSAKTGMCVGDIFMAIAQTMVRQNGTQSPENPKGMKLGKKDTKKKEGPCC